MSKQRILDLTYLGEIKQYDGGIFEDISHLDVQAEIDRISKEMDEISIESLKFDKWDFAAIFSIGLLEVGADLLFGNPKSDLSQRISNKSDEFGKYLHETKLFNHPNNPLDYQGYKFGGGDHRARTFGHDLMFFPLAIYSLCKGKFIDGYYNEKTLNLVIARNNQYGSDYEGLPPDQAVLAYLCHMTADFFTKKSLQVPGFGGLAHFPNRDIRKLVATMYGDGFNLRHVLINQTIPVVCTEILMRIYFYFRTRSLELSKDMRRNKLNKLLLMSHTLALGVNIGKIYITNNPAAFNLPMLIRVIWLCVSVAKDEMRLNQKCIEKVNLGIIKNKLETLQTMMLMNESVYYVKEVNKFFLEKAKEFDRDFNTNQKNIEEGVGDLARSLDKFKDYHSEC